MMVGLTLGVAGSSLAAEELPVNPFGIDDPLIGRLAPALEVEAWFNSRGFSLEELRGKVVVLEFFQLWCPGCNAFSIPLMTRWSQDTFADEPGIAFVSVHTVFEGHDVQTNDRLSRLLIAKNMRQPVAVDRHRGRDPVPVTMQRYKTGGTPCIVIVDQQGMVRFKYLGAFTPEPVEAFLRQLLQATSPMVEVAS
ncbi:MAG: TlpA family protein disulfide reductase [Candidatus Omnitrophica bacterium]|nr:TlpA family protein disulfide reductase [Candidatus Omnitrophota bacterium]